MLSDRRELFSSLRHSIRSKSVLKAMKRVPREAFVPACERPRAYLDIPLSIGEGQTISQPYIVALITEGLRLQRADRALVPATKPQCWPSWSRKAKLLPWS